MITAFVLIQAARGQVSALAQTLAELPGVAEVYSVSGQHDLVAIARVASADDLSVLVTDRLAGLPGIVSTQTLLAFRAYSRHDLESLFEVGLRAPGP
ncbi:MAG TPA: Lrp/AsnC ligand binding domain-containing protein [Immundisolibacter sp.]|uniref:AsnC family transcriptional regulator n=1 Tax=Immundisolibacter cernigliae TaxID=1810504 RepID=A0A1B1YT18_9GAMM|nr:MULTISPECIES: Lrp/AsnC ligand binding domain-containing protein [Immundisolibacter]ANX04010.1 AsnC family transcriptional regulator [Immundisolibacter cernigliae]MBC7161579.1 Lrp/AsnC ligand binding domain-containing protein [Immundisolibacter sp.]HEX2797867.1 Lrp/AsnC ligand binding domain-containing protein [Immundisolibacter sp.]